MNTESVVGRVVEYVAAEFAATYEAIFRPVYDAVSTRTARLKGSLSER